MIKKAFIPVSVAALLSGCQLNAISQDFATETMNTAVQKIDQQIAFYGYQSISSVLSDATESGNDKIKVNTLHKIDFDKDGAYSDQESIELAHYFSGTKGAPVVDTLLVSYPFKDEIEGDIKLTEPLMRATTEFNALRSVEKMVIRTARIERHEPGSSGPSFSLSPTVTTLKRKNANGFFYEMVNEGDSTAAASSKADGLLMQLGKLKGSGYFVQGADSFSINSSGKLEVAGVSIQSRDGNADIESLRLSVSQKMLGSDFSNYEVHMGVSEFSGDHPAIKALIQDKTSASIKLGFRNMPIPAVQRMIAENPEPDPQDGAKIFELLKAAPGKLQTTASLGINSGESMMNATLTLSVPPPDQGIELEDAEAWLTNSLQLTANGDLSDDLLPLLAGFMPGLSEGNGLKRNPHTGMMDFEMKLSGPEVFQLAPVSLMP